MKEIISKEAVELGLNKAIEGNPLNYSVLGFEMISFLEGEYSDLTILDQFLKIDEMAQSFAAHIPDIANPEFRKICRGFSQQEIACELFLRVLSSEVELNAKRFDMQAVLAELYQVSGVLLAFSGDVILAYEADELEQLDVDPEFHEFGTLVGPHSIAPALQLLPTKSLGLKTRAHAQILAHLSYELLILLHGVGERKLWDCFNDWVLCMKEGTTSPLNFESALDIDRWNRAALIEVANAISVREEHNQLFRDVLIFKMLCDGYGIRATLDEEELTNRYMEAFSPEAKPCTYWTPSYFLPLLRANTTTN
ncbi:hypothetical protein [Leucobacter massiliensis]|uniref:hypothetical protein n=1 Tax=Leucobacter massiliensis TaxID=1686285 RepID=UPI0011B22318|nr:hypothetical protein [Leucobacter massiliensis]